MDTYDKMFTETVERSMSKGEMPLAELIKSENLQTFARGYVNVLSVDELGVAMIPYHGFMILVRDRYDNQEKDYVDEYAIYRRTGKDTFDNDIGEWSGNVFVAEAVYELEHVGEETFEDMVSAIKYASDLIDRITDKN